MNNDSNQWRPDPIPPQPTDDITFIDSDGSYSRHPYAQAGSEYDPPVYGGEEVVHKKPPRRGWPLVAWVVILLTLVIILGRGFILVEEEQAVAANFEGLAGETLEVQAKFIVGGRAVQRQAMEAKNEGKPLTDDDKKQLREAEDESLENAKDLATGSPSLRVRAAILAGEFGEPEDALKTLNETSELIAEEKEAGTYVPTKREERLVEIAKTVYEDHQQEDFEAKSLSDEDREFFTEELGWFGELALHPEERQSGQARSEIIQEATWLFGGLLGIIGAVICMLLVGFVTAVIFVILYFSDQLKSRVTPPTLNGGIYAETFALWLFGFSVVGFVFAFVPIPPGFGMLAQLVVFFGSLIVLAWPVIRGVPFSQVRRDIGWTMNSPIELLFGVVNYLATLPLLLLAILALAILAGVVANIAPDTTEVTSQLTNPQGPTHPIAFEIGNADPLTLLQLIILACVAAPIVEETMFRGVLYRHLRDASAFMRIAPSVLFSTLFNAFIFAIIHPQGLLGVPVLMALAIGFSLSREWRGSLAAPMISHGVSNGVTMFVMVFVFS